MIDDDAPPDGGHGNKPMHAALSAALRRQAPGDDGQMAPMLQLIVHKLIAKAAGGDISAIKEILDRMDGKSAAGATMDDGPRKVTLEWKDPQQWSTIGPDANSSPFIADGSDSPAS